MECIFFLFYFPQLETCTFFGHLFYFVYHFAVISCIITSFIDITLFFILYYMFVNIVTIIISESGRRG